jgi:hypothetical protein
MKRETIFLRIETKDSLKRILEFQFFGNYEEAVEDCFLCLDFGATHILIDMGMEKKLFKTTDENLKNFIYQLFKNEKIVPCDISPSSKSLVVLLVDKESFDKIDNDNIEMYNLKIDDFDGILIEDTLELIKFN